MALGRAGFRLSQSSTTASRLLSAARAAPAHPIQFRSLSSVNLVSVSHRASPEYRIPRPSSLAFSRQNARSYWWSSKPAAAAAATATPDSVQSTISEPVVSASSSSAAIPESPTAAPPTADPLATITDATAPLPPSIDTLPTSLTDVVSVLSTPTGDALGDMAAAGLARWTPPGLVQMLLEQLHVTFSLSWAGAILAAVLLTRAAVLPVLFKVQVNNGRLAKINPELQLHMANAREAKEKGDQVAMTTAVLKAQTLLRENDANPARSMLGPLVQFPLALGFFFGIRGMCALPLESLKTGGLAWFTDLTIPDPYYVLPVLSAGAMLTMMRAVSAETVQTENSAHMLNFFRVITLVSIPVIANLPSGLLVYFCCNGLVLLVQSQLTRLPAVRSYIGLQPLPTAEQVLKTQNDPKLNPGVYDTYVAGLEWYKGVKKNAKKEIARAEAEALEKARREREEKSLRVAAIRQQGVGVRPGVRRRESSEA
ncbi:hypothetical protein BOTBODRAFT_37444 [Botryobasidium botryosum FD-172 SS1]|uniref:Membrane insertase YidC/Oxa/ALB C-terminal domain-containing protein n=1 Tax=Botryobasidium botryosum (strain FD-172 SS1) TaxID=930990 RepID=A0A067MBF3_BOTB1|nr:hypothetical protein BOTBODRAFT_37444 [Botryobasidium botryosum FD-172 SS1]